MSIVIPSCVAAFVLIAASTALAQGRPCRIRTLSDVDAGLPMTEVRMVEAPRHGTLEFPTPDVALYTPSPGYTGPDRYTFAGRGPTRAGKTAALRVTVRATVVNP